MSDKKTIVVGHAPSMIGSNNGEFIDSFDCIIRFPIYGDWQTEKDFGTRTSYYCGTDGALLAKMNQAIPDCGYFAWNKKKRSLAPELVDKIKKIGGYDVSGFIYTLVKRLPKHRKYSSFDTGSVAIFSAIKYIKKPVIAIGCDFLATGEKKRYKYVGSSAIEGRTISKRQQRLQGRHPFKESRELIDKFANECCVEVEFV